ncbi:MAG: AIR synthase related protein [Candidatus Paceibacterota bacterium]|jgi:phosphoribosylformylglycinamidine cyclo-ligase
MPQKSAYELAGVDYSSMDPFKVACQKRAARTMSAVTRFPFIEPVEASRGESAYEFRIDKQFRLGHVEEGLGTKNLVADALRSSGKTYYDQIAQDAVAMAVNDLTTLGIFPISVQMHLAVGDSSWFKDDQRVSDLIEGWAKACEMARAGWTGGETPTLLDIIIPGASLLSGSAVGVSLGELIINPWTLSHGDAIILLEGTGIHANGLTLARKIGKAHGYRSELSDGRTFGESLLDPTPIYCGFVEDCLRAGVDIHYAVNITGHGFRKIMRDKHPYRYVIDKLPRPQPVFNFIKNCAPSTIGQAMSDKDMYGTFNMGAGYCLMVPQQHVKKLFDVLNSGSYGFGAINAGRVEGAEMKAVEILPLGITFEGDTLKVR